MSSNDVVFLCICAFWFGWAFRHYGQKRADRHVAGIERLGGLVINAASDVLVTEKFVGSDEFKVGHTVNFGVGDKHFVCEVRHLTALDIAPQIR